MLAMNQPLSISVVTPSFNQARFIRKNIESVLEQGLDGVEHIVVDGGSTDGTVEVLKEYPHLKWVSEADDGQADALNKAIAMSGGDIIAWINSDDYLAPGALGKAREFFTSHPLARMICGNRVVVDERGEPVKRGEPRMNRRHLLHPWKGGTCVFQPGVVFLREVYEKCGPFDMTLHYAMDYDFFLKASGAFEIHHLREDLGCFRVYGGTKTGEAFGPAWKEVRRVLLRYLAKNEPERVVFSRFYLHTGEARVWVCDAMDAQERGELATARRLFFQAFCRWAPSLLCYPHLCFRLRQLIGRERYERLRKRLKGARTEGA